MLRALHHTGMNTLRRQPRLVTHRCTFILARDFHFFNLNSIPLIAQVQTYLFPQKKTIPSPKPKNNKKKRIRKKKSVDPDSAEGILLHDLQEFSKTHDIKNHEIPDSTIQHYMNFSNFKTVENLKILDVNSNGQGMAILPSDHDPLNSSTIIVVPFVVKHDIIQARIGVHHKSYAEGHLLKVIRPSEGRKDELVRCKHFGECSGCQLQMLSYSDQLLFKKNTVIKAYKKHGFDVQTLPIGETVGSPLQYGYRTKITPHFNSNRSNIMIGFERSGIGKGMIQVEACDIARPVISNALISDREKLEDIVKKYKKSGTILLRDKSIGSFEGYTTDHTEVISQRVGDYVFQFPAGEFFQNNSSILPLLIDDIGQYLESFQLENLIDTYCGSGFIGISLSHHVRKLIGIEISAGNLKMASTNAELNGLESSQFILGSSEEIFKNLDKSHTDPEKTCIVMDPSRKGSSHTFLSQLSEFRPKLIAYVSCNVFTQARDLDYFLNHTENGCKYEILSIKGYDFFPQTKHVESLTMLQLK